MVYGKVRKSEGTDTAQLAIGQAGARAQVWLVIFTTFLLPKFGFLSLPTWILPSAGDLLQYQCWEWGFGSLFCFVLFDFLAQ